MKTNTLAITVGTLVLLLFVWWMWTRNRQTKNRKESMSDDIAMVRKWFEQGHHSA
jgi:low temperature requirement protein LtrA